MCVMSTRRVLFGRRFELPDTIFIQAATDAPGTVKRDFPSLAAARSCGGAHALHSSAMGGLVGPGRAQLQHRKSKPCPNTEARLSRNSPDARPEQAPRSDCPPHCQHLPPPGRARPALHTAFSNSLLTQSAQTVCSHSLPTQSAHTVCSHSLLTQSAHTVCSHSLLTGCRPRL